MEDQHLEVKNFKQIYHRLKINKELLKLDKATLKNTIGNYLRDEQSDTLPKGKLISIHFNSYVNTLDTWTAIDYQDGTDPQTTPLLATGTNVPDLNAFICSHTDIRIEDTHGRLLTEPTDLKDYNRSNWGELGARVTPFKLTHNEQITVKWDTLGNAFPPCGEFIFTIQQEISCPV
ncbi:hypothetical protein [Tenacibaculum dicentrarchi]|uniref:hypothetical protein n=1 Tax=Tenacibaculum dicentrarchi TaxID=669041 RepID=UPI000C7E3AE1|nr:hypothetical protein [Tenacibaculum dicentrarchi]SOU87843.1 conserved hypothetical protein [Tenacibaculum dicentrarchi]